MRVVRWVVALLLLTVFSDSGRRYPVLIINNQQSLVIKPAVLSAGITPATPLLTSDRERLHTYSILSNDHPATVTMY